MRWFCAHLFGIVGQSEPTRELIVAEIVDPLEELFPPDAVGHSQGFAGSVIGDQLEIPIESLDGEELVDEGVHQTLIKLVVDATAVDAGKLGIKYHKQNE